MRQPVSPITRFSAGLATGSFRLVLPMVAVVWPAGTTASHSPQAVVAAAVPSGRFAGAVAEGLTKYAG